MELTDAQIKLRGKFLRDIADRVGVRKLEKWLNDPDKLSIINALVATCIPEERPREVKNGH